MLMKHHFAYLALLSTILCSCGTIPSPDPNPSPQPVPEQTEGPYIVRELDENGKVFREWSAYSYRHILFPKGIIFSTASGAVTLPNKESPPHSSFEVQQASP
jgi:hypothetical protein